LINLPLRHRQFDLLALSLSFVACLCLAMSASAQSTAENPQAGAPFADAAGPAQFAPDQTDSTAQVSDPPPAPGHASSIFNGSGAANPGNPSTAPASGSAIAYTLPEAPLPEATRSMKFVEPGQQAPTLNSGDKFLLGLRSTFSPFAVSGWFAVAGYEQLRNGNPNFGTDRGAFGRRLEDASLRDASEDLLSDSVMSTAFREDPRYYRLGPSHRFVNRLFYAASRSLITRTDSGGTSANFALLTGNLAGAVLTNAYYPQANRTGSQTVETFAGSIGGSAFGDVMDEFFGGFLHHDPPVQH
jgi:hypothetical protein